MPSRDVRRAIVPGLAALAFAGAVSTIFTATSAAAPLPAGDLKCTVDGGVGVVLGAYRNLACSYERPGQPTEKYEGFTGIITSRSNNAQVVTFQVFSETPKAIVDLGGDYDGRGFGPAGSPALAGGRSGAIVLEPVENGSAVRLAELNIVLGVSQLHLNFAGIDSHRTGRARRRLPGETSR